MEERRGQIDHGTVLLLFVTLISIPVHSSAKNLLERWAEDRVTQPELTWENFLYTVDDEQVTREVANWEKFPLSGYDACSAPGVICRDEDIYKVTGACTAVEGLTCTSEGVPLTYSEPPKIDGSSSDSANQAAAIAAGIAAFVTGSPVGGIALIGAALGNGEDGNPEKGGNGTETDEDNQEDPPPRAEAPQPSPQSGAEKPSHAETPPETPPETPETPVAEQVPEVPQEPKPELTPSQEPQTVQNDSAPETPSVTPPQPDPPSVAQVPQTIPNEVFSQPDVHGTPLSAPLEVVNTSSNTVPAGNEASSEPSVLEEGPPVHGAQRPSEFRRGSEFEPGRNFGEDDSSDFSSLRVNPQRPQEVPKHDPTLYKYVRVDEEKEKAALGRVEEALSQSNPQKVVESLESLMPLLPDVESGPDGLSKAVVRNMIAELGGPKTPSFGFDDEKPKSFKPSSGRTASVDALGEFPDDKFLKSNPTQRDARQVAASAGGVSLGDSDSPSKFGFSKVLPRKQRSGRVSKRGSRSDLNELLLERTSKARVNQIAMDLAKRIHSHKSQKKETGRRDLAVEKKTGNTSKESNLEESLPNKLANVAQLKPSLFTTLAGAGGVSLFFIFGWFRRKKRTPKTAVQ